MSLVVLSRLGRGDSNLQPKHNVSHGQALGPRLPHTLCPFCAARPRGHPLNQKAACWTTAGNPGSNTTPTGLHVQTRPLCLAQEALVPTFPHPCTISSKSVVVQNKPEGKWTPRLGVMELRFHLDIMLPSRAHM